MDVLSFQLRDIEPEDDYQSARLAVAIQVESNAKEAYSQEATLVREQGLQSLTRGIGPRTVYYAWVCAAFFGLYEAFRRYFEAHGL